MSTDTTSTCKGCGTTIWVELEKALDGTYASVWASQEGWICESDGNEHVPDGPDSVHLRDLNAHTLGLSADDVRDDDSVFTLIVDGMENVGHSRVRVERDLREWLAFAAADPAVSMDPVEALTYAILAINTDQEPTATSGNDLLYLELNAERALAALDRIRDFLIASGEDLPDYVYGKDES